MDYEAIDYKNIIKKIFFHLYLKCQKVKSENLCYGAQC